MRLVVHQVDRPDALGELVRVLVSRGRATVATFDPEGFETFWLTQLFPAVERIDRMRFPTRDELEAELAEAGFARVRVHCYAERGSLTHADALARVERRFISTLRFLNDAELAQGLELAERELPDVVHFERPWLLAVAETAAAPVR